MTTTPLKCMALGLLMTSCTCSSTTPVAPIACGTDETLCGTSCAKLRTDDARCGSCDKACASGTACANFVCFPGACAGKACAPDQVCANERCVDKACLGVACPLGLTCTAGVCACGTPFRSCGGACVDPSTDDSHCGGCDVACGSASSCGGGACLPDDCPAQECDPLSVCYRGSCIERACVGVACPSNQKCRAGACVCEEGGQLCGATCSSVKTDSSNCGACGRTCPANEKCAGAVCLPKDCPGGASCDPLSVCYQGTCTQAACVGVACSGDTVCSNGACQCPAGKSDCGGTCASLTQDSLHCGNCATTCAAGQACLDGHCVANACSDGKVSCGGTCVDTRIEPAHCGACGNACGGSRVCVAGVCQCPQGLVLCGGTCVNLQTDGNHCGGCGKSCNGGTCTSAICSCPPLQMLCQGTCASTQTDDANCGVCGRACANGQKCAGGSCACPPGTSACGGLCIPTDADTLNCGACGRVCAQGTRCVASTCQAPIVCQMNFNSAPSDCPAFPLDSACGQPSFMESVPFNGSISATTPSATFPFGSTSLAEELRLQGTLTGTVIMSAELRNSMGAALSSTGYSPCCYATSTESYDVRATSSAFTCARPSIAGMQFGNNPGASFAGTIERYRLSGKYNTGGVSPIAAVDFALDTTSMRVCDHVCGDVKTVCGDDRQYYRLTLPAKKAAVVEAVFAGRPTGTAFDLNVTSIAGGQLCSLVANSNVTVTPGLYRARLVNNLDVPQTVLLVPFSRGGKLNWNLAIAVEP